MKPENSDNSISSWLVEKIVIYVLPVGFVLNVDATKCFPYNFARWLWKGTKNQYSPHIQDGFLYGVGVAISASIYFFIKFLIKSKRKD
jgi:hypothetical protein